MSTRVAVFIDSTNSLESVAQKIAEIVGGEFEASIDKDYPFVLRVGDPDLMCLLGYNEYKLPGLSQHRQEYRFELIVRPIIPVGGSRYETMIDTARHVFEKLKATNQFPLMSVWDLEEYLDEFIPDPDNS